MPLYEVFCPAAPPEVPADATLHVEAEHWLAALKEGLRQIGRAGPPTNVFCDVQADGSIHVSEPAGGGVFRIRELRAGVPAAAGSAPSGAGAAAPAPIGRPRAAPPPEEVLGELFLEVSDLARLGRQEGLERLVDLAMRRVDAEAGSILVSTPSGRELAFAAVRGPAAKELVALGRTVPVGLGIAGFCVREDVCLAVSDAEKDPRFHRAISEAIGYRTRSLLCAPIAHRGVVLGAFEVLNKRGGAPFGRADLSVVSYLAHQAGDHLARHGAG
jgi:hypothetical protein